MLFRSDNQTIYGVPYTATVAFATDDVELYVDGVTTGTPDTSAAMPTGLTTIAVGTGWAGANNLSGTIRNVKIFNRRLNDTQVGTL